jgi:hypothetical protein
MNPSVQRFLLVVYLTIAMCLIYWLITLKIKNAENDVKAYVAELHVSASKSDLETSRHLSEMILVLQETVIRACGK